MFKVIVSGLIKRGPPNEYAETVAQTIRNDDVKAIDASLILDALNHIRALATVHNTQAASIRASFRINSRRHQDATTDVITWSRYNRMNISSTVTTTEQIEALIAACEEVGSGKRKHYLVSVRKPDGSLLRTRLFSSGKSADHYKLTTDAAGAGHCEIDIVEDYIWTLFDNQKQEPLAGRFATDEAAIAWLDRTGKTQDRYLVVKTPITKEQES